MDNRLAVAVESLETRVLLADPGATVATAQDLGTLTATPQSASDRLQSGDVDLFRFSLAADSTLAADVTGLSGQSNARLFRDLNGDGVLASSEQLEYRDNYFGGSSFNLNGEPLMAGAYFLQLAPSNVNTNTAYTLAISATAIVGSTDVGPTAATARNLGSLSTTVRTFQDLSQWGDNDIYRFTLGSDSTLAATVSGLSELVQARIYRDLNGDGVLANSEQLESRDNYYGGSSFTFNGEPLTKGTYFLQISPWDTGVNSVYSLSISATAITGSIDAGGTPAAARNLGTLSTTEKTVKDMSQWGDTDVYKFTLTRDSTIAATVTGLSELVQARIYRDLDGDGVLTSGEQLESRDNYYSSSGTFNFNGEPLMKGTYFLQISPWDTYVNTAYTLVVSAALISGTQDAGATPATARSFGTLSTLEQTVIDLSQWGDTDVYRFTLAADSTLSATVTGLSELVQARLYRDLNGDGVLTSGEQLESRDNYYTSTGTFTFNGEPLTAGTYFLQISPWDTYVNTAYTLAISATAIAGTQDAGGTPATAYDFGTLTTTEQTVKDLSQWGETDVYRFTLAVDSTLSATVTGLSELVQARLYRDLNGDGLLSSDELLETRDNYYTSTGSFTFNGEPLTAGTYFLQIFPWDSYVNTAYTLAISATAIAGTQDAGGTVASARNLGTLTSTVQTVKDMAQWGDSDLYKFTLTAGKKLNAAVTGLSETVQARLYRDLNNDGILTSNEQVAYRDNYYTAGGFDFNNLSLVGGTYFLQFAPWNSGVNTVYDLTISAS